jgi:hypothetical protein
MPRQAKVSGEFKAPAKSMLDESNTMSFLNHNRSAEADYYKLQNREKQLATVQHLSAAEQRYVLGLAPGDGKIANATAQITQKIQKIHEQDLIELRALVYLQSLPDSSAELLMLKQYCGCQSREQIASYIAEKQMKKLFLSQIEAISGGANLTSVYKQTIKKGATNFLRLFADSTEAAEDGDFDYNDTSASL